MKAIVTGGGGFLGKAIVKQLLDEGHNVINFSRKPHPQLLDWGVECRTGNLKDLPTVIENIRDVDIVFHVASKVGLWGSYDDFYNTNVVGTQNVISACRKAGIKKLVYTSSPSVVFNGKDMEGVNESVPYPDKYKAHYPQTKAEAEKIVAKSNGPSLATVILRPHLIWGPDDNHLIPGILKRGSSGQMRRIGRKVITVDFTYIDDAANAHVLAAKKLDINSPVAGKKYFISQNDPYSFWKFANKLIEEAGGRPIEKSIPTPIAYGVASTLELFHRLVLPQREPRVTRFLVEELITSHWFDISAAKKDFNYSPEKTVDMRLNQYFSHMKERMKS